MFAKETLKFVKTSMDDLKYDGKNEMKNRVVSLTWVNLG